MEWNEMETSENGELCWNLKISMRRVIMDDLQLTPYKKTVSIGNFRIFKAEKSGQGHVDVKGNGASHQQDLHFVRQEDVHGWGCDQ